MFHQRATVNVNLDIYLSFYNFTIRLSEPYGLVVNKAIVKRVNVALSKSWRLNQDNGTGQLCPVKELRLRSQIDQCSSWCNILWFTLRFLFMIVLLMTMPIYKQTNDWCFKIYIYIHRWKKYVYIYSYLYHSPSKPTEETNLEEQNGLSIP